MTSDPQLPRQRSNRSVALLCAGVVAGMVGMSYAAVPLYDLFCRVTGYGGTPSVAEELAGPVLERDMIVRFDANVAGGLPWRFSPAERSVTVKVGEMGKTHYIASNQTDQAVTGTATFNVTPQKAGPYFSKIACFCFNEQTLAPGETAELPVTFFVDPQIADDPLMDDVTTITLSYTFFRVETPSAANEETVSLRTGASGEQR